VSDYWKRMEYLRNRIQDQRMLRDAQVQDGPEYEFFQNEIKHLTDELIQWEQNIDQLNRLDINIAILNRDTGAVKRDKLYAADNWLRLAIGCGVIGATLLALSFRWSLSLLLPVTGVILLVTALIAMLMSIRTRTSVWNAMSRANRQLDQMRGERDTFIPPRYPSIDPFPRFSYEVVVRKR
jgi:hypothetical protein